MKKSILIFLLFFIFVSSAIAGTSIRGLGVRGLQITPNRLSITSPVSYQTFQRSGSTGSITVTGTYGGLPTAIEARFNGGAWSTIVASPSGNTFSGTLSSQTQGQGTLQVRFTNDIAAQDSETYVGIGDVYLCAGQSNMSGRGAANQSYSHATLKAVNYGNDYIWQDLVDPYDGTTNQVDTVSKDTGLAAGSWVPLLATQIMANQSVPVAFVPCAMGGTGIASWQPNANHQLRSTLYGSCVYRALQAGGVKAVLWWQGETDAGSAMDQTTYANYLTTIVDTFFSDLSVNTVIVNLQNSTAVTDADEDVIRAAIAQVIGADAHAKAGPDFSDKSSNDDYHFTSTVNLQMAADRWFSALQSLFY